MKLQMKTVETNKDLNILRENLQQAEQDRDNFKKQSRTLDEQRMKYMEEAQ